MGRKYTRAEVRLYKRSWELRVKRSRGLYPPKKREPVEPTAIELLAMEIAALPDGSPRVMRIFEQLETTALLIDIRDQVLSAYAQLAWLVPLNNPRTAAELAERVWSLSWHFAAGPREIPFRRGDVGAVKQSVEMLGTIGTWSAEFAKRVEPLKASVESLLEFHEVALAYRREDIESQIVGEVLAIREACSGQRDNKRRIAAGLGITGRALRRIQSEVQKRRPSWRMVLRRLSRTLDREIGRRTR